jgi:hypothetical protein
MDELRQIHLLSGIRKPVLCKGTEADLHVVGGESDLRANDVAAKEKGANAP